MSVKVITPPASEPVSLAEAKLFLRVDHADEDVLIDQLIAAAREAVEAACGRALISRRVRERIDLWSGSAEDCAFLSWGPILTVYAVRVLAKGGAQSVIDPERYWLRSETDRPVLVFEPGFPATLRSAGVVEIEYEAGFADTATALPSALRLATLQVIAAFYETRSSGALAQGTRALVRPFAPVRL